MHMTKCRNCQKLMEEHLPMELYVCLMWYEEQHGEVLASYHRLRVKHENM